MSSLSTLGCVALALLLPLLTIGFLMRRGIHQWIAPNVYRGVSEQLGLQADTRGNNLHGHLSGRPLWIGEVKLGGGRNKSTVLCGILGWRIPLGLGLECQTIGKGHRWTRRQRKGFLTIEDKELNEQITLRGHHGPRTSQLFNPPVATALKGLLEEWPEVVLNDQAITIYFHDTILSKQRLLHLIESLTHVADAIEQSRRQIGIPSELSPFLESWTQFASDEDLSCDANIPSVSGKYQNHRLLVVPHRVGDQFQGEIRLFLPHHRPLGLHLLPRESYLGDIPLGQDISVGDPEFDNTFVIKGYNRTAIIELLSPKIRPVLLRLQQCGSVELDDICFRLHQTDLHIGTIRTCIEDMVSIGNELNW